ncbi:10759_t:CDS:2 [Acaulospora colombiana]|uniref:10759_t:CDS:1 n=1 Tax=Acaulospora colombiana TaxID=27376 RepID=A0ACA9KBN9_9GLOM|nr:10759_t:CDS:2 [Acaulospora colombiana]
MVKFMIRADKLRDQVRSRRAGVGGGGRPDDSSSHEKSKTPSVRENSESQGLVLFELQGELETVHEDIRGKEIGKLQFGENVGYLIFIPLQEMLPGKRIRSNGTPMIRVGHWTVAGQIIELEKPIMVVKRRSLPPQQVTPGLKDVKSDNMQLDFRSESSMLAENFQRSVEMVSGLAKDLEMEDYDDDNLEVNEIPRPGINSHKPMAQGRSSDKEIIKLENLNVEYDAIQEDVNTSD